MDTYYNTKEFRRVLQTYESSLENGIPVYQESSELTDISQYYYSLGRRADAEKAVERALSMFPGSVEPLAFKIRIALFQEYDIDKAWQLLDEIEDKTDLEYHYLKAEIMCVQGNYDGADEYLEGIYGENSDEDPDDIAMDICGIFIDYEQVDRAEKWLDKCQDRESDDFKELLGRIKLGQGEAEESEKIFNSLVDHDPFSVPYWNQLAQAQFYCNDLSKSIESSDYALAINPDDIEALLNKANAMNSLSNYPEAEKFYRRYLAIMPDNVSVMATLAMVIVYQGDGRETEALNLLIKGEQMATASGDNNALYEVLQNKAFVLSRIGGHMNEAIALVGRMETMSKADRCEFNILRGHIYLENGQEDKAREEFMVALKRSDYDKDVMLRIAVSNYDNGYYALAYNLVRSLIDEYGYHTCEVYSYMAIFSYLCGKREEYEKYKSLAYEKSAWVADLFFKSVNLLNK